MLLGLLVCGQHSEYRLGYSYVLCSDILNMICLVVYPTYWDPHPGVLQMARYNIVFVDLQLKDCFWCGGLIGNFCLKFVLSAKNLVSTIGHRIHAVQQRFMGFLKFCRLSLYIKLYG